MKTAQLAILVLAIILLSLSASAENEYYIGIGGAVSDIHPVFGKSYSGGISAMTGIGRPLNDNYSLQLSVAYQFLPLEKPPGGISGGDYYHISTGLELRRSLYTHSDGLIIYVLAGAGYSWAEIRELSFDDPMIFDNLSYADGLLPGPGEVYSGMYWSLGTSIRLGHFDLSIRFMPELPGGNSDWVMPITLNIVI